LRVFRLGAAARGLLAGPFWAISAGVRLA